MKIPPRSLDAFVKKPDAKALAVLVYGPDEGLVRERVDALTKTVAQDASDPFAVAEVAGDSLSDNPSRLMDEIQSISMFGGRRVVKVWGADDKAANLFKSALSNMRAGDNFVVISAGELSTRSPLRTLFEYAENAAAIPCYVESESDLARTLSNHLKEAGYRISSEALLFLAGNLVGDRAMARGEVEKLITYMGAPQKEISLEDVSACIGNSAELPMDDLCKFTAAGNFPEADRVLRVLMAEDANAVMVLRAVQRYFTRLQVTKARMARGDSAETAADKLQPKLFFKYKDAFLAQLSFWSMDMLDQALSVLMTAEAKCKQTGSSPELLCGRAILSLSQMAHRAAGQRRRAS